MTYLKCFVIAVFASVCASASDLDDAKKQIPEIAKDQTKVIEILWDLDETNRNTFIEFAVKAFMSYPASPAVRSNMVARLNYCCFLATNVAPTVSLQVPRITQLEH